MSRTVKHEPTGIKAISHHCRNNGECPYCTGNRTFERVKKAAHADQDIQETLDELTSTSTLTTLELGEQHEYS